MLQTFHRKVEQETADKSLEHFLTIFEKNVSVVRKTIVRFHSSSTTLSLSV